jgi:hypothetical protein
MILFPLAAVITCGVSMVYIAFKGTSTSNSVREAALSHLHTRFSKIVKIDALLMPILALTMQISSRHFIA